MHADRDLRLVLLALRDGLIDPARLAAAAADWRPESPGRFAEFLVARGLLTADQCRRLEHAAEPSQAHVETATIDVEPGAMHTADLGPATEDSAFATDGRPPVAGDRYRVAELHRTGGLGRVWRVRDAVLGRDVALKDLHPHRARDDRLRARFVEEARITGQLEHPCIVPLYDLIDGPAGPCYTMRFVAGKTLAEAARDYHQGRATGRADPLALAALLDAFVAVCRAVAYAHARGVLHRDLKGQNIVLGEYGEVFVLDWGLAKVAGGPPPADGPAVVTPDPAGARQETVSGAVLGTPAFMAPELAAGGVASTASDVYGLGAVLYVVLTGRPPYDGEGFQDILDQVQAADPPRPRAVNPDCPPALEAICRQAMARDPAGRYPSAEALAADVRLWRADEPVAAHPEAWLARVARWGRRHRPAVFGAVAVLLTAVVGLAVSTVLVVAEQRRTAAEKEHAEREWARAEENLDAAGGLALNLLDISEKKLRPIRQTETARKEMTEAALATFRQALAQRPDDPKLRERTAMAYRYSAHVHRLMNENATAEQYYREAVRLFEDLVAERPAEPAVRDLLAETLRDQAQTFNRLGRPGDAVATGRRAAGLAEGLLAADPGRPEYRRTLGTGLIDLSGYEHTRGQFAASEESARRSADLLRGLVDAAGKSPQPGDHLYLAMALHRRAIALRDLDRLTDSLAASADALTQLRLLPAGDPNAQHFRGRTLVEQAKALSRVPERRAEAEADVGRAIALWDDLQKRSPQFAVYREWQAAAYEVRGQLRAALGQTAPAAEDLEKSRTMLEKLIAEAPDQPGYRGLLGRTYLTLGRLEAAGGNAPRAAEWLTKARAAFRAALDRSPESALDQRALGEAEAELKRVAPAGG
ncbi:MAG TPA: serine/threonine-protein kinase [Gemmataceae bacterium]|jgi:serine/threonine-protein kinase